MATVALTPDVCTEAGLAATYVGSLNTGNTYTFRNNGRTILYFKKTGANACVVTINSPKTLKGHALAAQTVNVPANTGDVHLGPFDRDIYNDVNNDVSFTVSEVTGLSVAVMSLG